MNELLLLGTVVVYFGLAVLFAKLFGKGGLFAWIVIGTIFMNLELLKTVDAFGITMALGNVMLASTFLCTDILNEVYGESDAKRGAYIGCAAVLVYLIATQFLVAFAPGSEDWAGGMMGELFALAPRLTIASVVVFALVQVGDVLLYNRIKTATDGKYLWLRNCGSTLVSQFINAFLYMFLAFYGVYDVQLIVELALSTFAVTAVCALLDTPFVYLARKVCKAD